MFSQHITPLGLDNFNTETLHHVASVCMAYAFDVPLVTPDNTGNENENGEDGDDLVSDNGEDEETILSMIPLADMLNADADRNNARLCCDNEDLEMRTIKPISKGDEIFNDYGQLPQSDLLRRYGYTTPNYSIYDVAEISIGSISATFNNGIVSLGIQPLSNKDLQDRIDLAQREDVYEESYDLAHPDDDGPSIPNELLALIYLLLVDEENLASISSSQSSLPSRSKLATELVGQVLVSLLNSREMEYSTTLAQDEELLRAGTGSHRTQMAIQVRLGEKRVIKEAIQEASSFEGSNKRMRTSTSKQIDFTTRDGKGKRGAEDSSRPRKKGKYN